MPFTLTMPKLSPTMEEGTITKWRIKVGDHVKAGDVILEVATDKATVEHNALDEGFLRKILLAEGQTAIVNQPIAIFTEKKEESIEGYQPEGEMPKEKAAPVAKEVTKEAAPASKEAKPAAAGLQQPAFVPEPPLEHYKFEPLKISGERLLASPLARKLAEEKGIDLSTVKGSGPHHRIMSRDLDLGQPDALVSFGRQEIPKVSPGAYHEEPLSPVRKVIAKRLQESKTFIPHFYVTQDVRADRLVEVREELKSIGVPVTYNDLIIRAVALALRQHPQMNSGFNSENASLIRFETIDISIAVSVEVGLITPILRYADYKNLGQISSEVKQLVSRARAGKLNREEYMGGSFTISNMGMFGVTSFSGIINPPQAGLLAVGGIEEKPVVEEGKIVIGKVMNLTLSADHRVVDGSDGAKFIKAVQKLLENPSILLV